MNIHDDFHVSFLEPYHGNIIPELIQAPPAPIIIEGQEEYEVEKILDSKIQRGKLKYLMDWKGCGPADRSWEPVENLEHCIELINRFHSKYQKPAPQELGLRGGSCKESFSSFLETS